MTRCTGRSTAPNKTLGFEDIYRFLNGLFEGDPHAKRVLSLSNATLDVIKGRTHSLFRQGCMLCELIPTMPEARLTPLVEKFAAMLAQQPLCANTFGVI